MASPDPEISFNIDETVVDDDAASVHSMYADAAHTMTDDRRVVHITHNTASNHVPHLGPNDSTNRTNNNPGYSNLSPNDHHAHTAGYGDSFQQSPSTRSIPVQHSFMKPDVYDGTASFEQYMSHFEDCAELSNWDTRTRVLILASSLRGGARSFYMSLSEAERRDYTYLKRRLTERFGSSKHQNIWLAKFENRRRLRGESIASLADDLRQLSQKAYADLDYISQERLTLNQLYKQVAGEMQCRCIDNGCSTVNDAVEVIERYEAILGTPHSTVVRALGEGPASIKPEPDVLKVVQRLETRLDRLEKVYTPARSYQHTRPNQTQRTCFGCNANDHFWRECLKKSDVSRFPPHMRRWSNQDSTSNFRQHDGGRSPNFYQKSPASEPLSGQRSGN